MSTRMLLLFAAAIACAAAQAQITPPTNPRTGETEIPGMPPPGPDEDRPDPTTLELPPPPEDTAPPLPTPEQNASRAGDLVGKKVQTPEGELLGKVENIIVDASTGEATHVVVARDNGDRGAKSLTPVPWNIVKSRLRGDVIVLERTRFERAPTYTADTMPDVDDPAWSVQADHYWSSIRTAEGEAGEASPEG